MSDLRKTAQDGLRGWMKVLEAELMRPQPEPKACLDNKPCKHGEWCTETYCQERCEFRIPPKAEPAACLSTKAQALVAVWLNQHMDAAAEAGAINDEMIEVAIWLCKPCQPEFYEYRNVPHTCNRCGLGWNAGWGYICTRNDCPNKVT